jgi:anti-sigma B factor antagonist
MGSWSLRQRDYIENGALTLRPCFDYDNPRQIKANVQTNPSKELGMQIDERTVGNVKVLDVTGQITMGQGNTQFKDKIHSMVNQGHKQILVNLGGVSYVDSAGLGELVAAFTTVSRNGGKMKLVNMTKKMNDLLAITKLSNVFETFDKEQDAVKSFN